MLNKKNKLGYELFAQLTSTEILNYFNSDLEGLSASQVEYAQKKYGLNCLELKQKTPLIVQFLKAYITPFTLVLIILGIISFFSDYLLVPTSQKDLTGISIITFMILVSGTMSLIQSVRSDQAAQKLAQMITVTTAVKRQAQPLEELAVQQVVCGDIIKLAAGDMIPADLRLLETKDLFVSQASLTGESYPVEKTAAPDYSQKNPVEYANLAFMGTNVISGSAMGIVVAVGKQTLFGKSATQMTQQTTTTNFDLGLKKVSYLLIRFMLLMAPIVIVINGLTKGDWWQAFIFGLSIAVGLTPEMLPLIVTTNLIKGANQLIKKKTIVKNLGAIQNFGAMDVLCTDKTGTLTQDKIVLECHLNCEGQSDTRVLRHGYLNSYYQTGLRNLLDEAIIEASEQQLDIKQLNFKKVDELPFDFKRRKMSVVLEDEQHKVQLITKGAIEEMLASCQSVELKQAVLPLNQDLKAHILQQVKELNQKGMRVIGIAQKNYDQIKEFSVADESEMTLIGYLAFLDPPKKTTQPALKALKQNGVAVKILTGDNALVAKAICQQVGLDAQNILTGQEIEQLSSEQLQAKLVTTNVFAKLDPQQKVKLVEAFQAKGQTVGFLGDGINDAPALKVADVGISVDTAVDIAKEAADIILLDKDLMVLEQGILAGRQVFGNIMKYIKITLSSNFGNMISVLCASIFLPFLPMLPLQLLFLNLVYDISCLSISYDKMDETYLQTPKNWQTDKLTKFMFWFGPTSSLFDLTTFVMLYFVICPAMVGGSYQNLDIKHQVLFVALFHAGWFVESLWTQTFVLHALRTEKIPFVQSNAAFRMCLLTGLGVIFGTIVPFTHFGQQMGLAMLPLSFFGVLFVTVLAYLCLVTIIKKIYLKRYLQLV